MALKSDNMNFVPPIPSCFTVSVNFYIASDVNFVSMSYTGFIGMRASAKSA